MTPAQQEKIDELVALSALLDEALTLSIPLRDAWLAALPLEFAGYRDRLQNMLNQAQRGTEAGLIPSQPDPGAALGLVQSCHDATGDDGDAAPGKLVGGYRLERELGRGGMGTVWLAVRADGLMNREVALKLPVVNLPQKMLIQRFERERSILSALTHTNIARLYDAGVSDAGQPFFVMEYIKGTTLLAHSDAKCLNLKDRLHLFAQVLDAVQHAHSNLVVHRDIKPANILVTDDNQVRLLDFGIAKLLSPQSEAPDTDPAGLADITQMAGAALTPDYASPEQLMHEPVRTVSDVYSLGVLLFELVCGNRPYRLRNASRAQLEAAIMSESRTPPSAMVSEEAAHARSTALKTLRRQIRGDLDAIILKAIQPSPAARYATADALAQDLMRWCKGEPVQAQTESRWYKAKRFILRNRLPVSAAALAFASLTVGLGVALWQAQVARVETQTARATEIFLTDLFKANSADQEDPAQAQKTSARTLLDRGAQRLGAGLEEAPEAKLRILKTLVNLHRDLALVEPGFSLQRQHLELYRKLHPEPSAALAAELIDTANAALATSSASKLTPSYLAQAEKTLDTLGDFQSPLRGHLEIAMAAQLDSDNCSALQHAQRGVSFLRHATPSASFPLEWLVDGLLQLTQSQTFCKPSEQALAAGQEAISLIKGTGRYAKLPDAYAFVSQAHMGLGQIDLGIASARQALQAAQIKHSTDAPPDSGILNTATNLVVKLVDFAHPGDALEVTQPLLDRALADVEHSDRDGVVSLLIQHAVAQKSVGLGKAALGSIRQATGLLSTYEAEDGQRVMVLDRYAEILASQGLFDQSEQVFNQAAQLHVKLNHTGTGMVNAHVARRVQFELLRGKPDQAERALAAFLVRQVTSGAVTKPQLEHRLLQAEIALAKRKWGAALEAATQVQERQGLYPLPVYVRDLLARALDVKARALKELGQRGEISALTKTANDIRLALQSVTPREQGQ